ncbi:MAG: hypothetical protein AAF939_12735 [Planctomycetota bacterium]
MGSFQQITLGLVCLVIAFLFGSYVNNQSPLGMIGFQKNQTGQDQGTDLLTSAINDNGSGMIQSRIGDGELDRLTRRPAPIVTMKKPFNSLSKGLGSASAFDETDLAGNDSLLPPPSQLEKPSEKGPSNLRRNDFGRSSGHHLIPDFSEIAAEFKNTPIALPETNGIGRHGSMAGESASRIVRSGEAQPGRLKQFANQMRANRSIAETEPIQTYEIKTAKPEQDSSWFTADDFVPKLLNAGENRQPPEMQKLASENRNYRSGSGPNSKPPESNWESVDSSPPTSKIDNDKLTSINSNQLAENGNSGQRGVGQAPLQLRDSEGVAEDLREVSGYDYSDPPFPEGKQLVDPQVSQDAGTFAGTFSGNRLKDWTQSQTTQPQSTGPDANRVRTLLPSTPLLNTTGKNHTNSDNQIRSVMNRGRTNLETPQPVLEPGQMIQHQVTGGETLQSISTKYFGRPNFYLDIYTSNRFQMRNPLDLREGMTLKFPRY